MISNTIDARVIGRCVAKSVDMPRTESVQQKYLTNAIALSVEGTSIDTLDLDGLPQSI